MIGLQSVENAAAQIARLETQIAAIDQMPERYRRYDRAPWFSRGVNTVPVDNYCILYIPDHAEKAVTILRVVYGGRNIEHILAEFEHVTN